MIPTTEVKIVAPNVYTRIRLRIRCPVKRYILFAKQDISLVQTRWYKLSVCILHTHINLIKHKS